MLATALKHYRLDYYKPVLFMKLLELLIPLASLAVLLNRPVKRISNLIKVRENTVVNRLSHHLIDMTVYELVKFTA